MSEHEEQDEIKCIERSEEEIKRSEQELKDLIKKGKILCLCDLTDIRIVSEP